MIKVIIIDDEKLIREGLVTYIDWKSLEIEICAVCKDAAEGIRAAVEQHPHLILADICLPDISGLDMFQQIRNYGLTCEIIFISSYSEFQYAQQAVKLGAFDYLLKPIEAEVLYDCVERCIRKINSHHISSRPKYDKSMIETALFHALTNINHADQNFFHLISQTEVPQDADILLWVSASEHIKHPEEIPEPPPILFSCEAQVSPVVKCCCLFIKGPDPFQMAQLLTCPSKQTLCIPVPQKTSLYVVLQRALCKLLINFAAKTPHTYYLPEQKKLSAEVIRDLNPQTVQLAIGQFLSFCREQQWTDNYVDFQFECFLFLENIYKQLTLVYGSPLPPSLDMHIFIEQLRTPNNLYDLFIVFSKILETTFEEVKKDACQSPYTKKTLSIIRTRYSENLSLKSVAKELHISTSYLSSVFKEDTGYPFSDYLFQHRMRIAYNLVRLGKLHIYEIGEQVGYPDVAQFSKSFKKHFGYSPRQLLNTSKHLES